MTVVPAPDASMISAALAEPDRRAAFAAVVLGARDIDEVAARATLSGAAAANALARLASMGLVVDRAGLVVNDQALRDAARASRARDESAEHDDQPADHRRVLRAFVRDGRLTQIPTSHAKRMVILDWLVQEFEPGRRYTEAAVNLILGQRHEDVAALRRYMVDNDFLDRAEGMYWRCGGSVR